MVQGASNCSTLFLLVASRSDGFRIFWRILGCLCCLGCILQVHIVKSVSDSFKLCK